MGLRGHDAEESGKSTSKWMWGCCGGCAGIAIVAVIGIGIFVYTMVRSQPVVPPETFFQTESDALAVLQMRPEHQHLTRLMQRLADDPPAGLGLSEEDRKKITSRAGNIPSQVSSLTPLQFVVLARKLKTPRKPASIPAGENWTFLSKWVNGPGKKKRFALGVAGSIKAYGGTINWVLSGLIQSFVEQGGHTEQHKNVEIGVPPNEDFYLAVLNNNVMVADNRKTLTGWIDQLKTRSKKTDKKQGRQAVFAGPSGLANLYGQMDTDAPLIFATTNTKGEIRAIVKTLREMSSKSGQDGRSNALADAAQFLDASGVASDSVVAFGGYAAMEGANMAAIHLYAQCEDRAAATQMSDQVSSELNRLLEGASNVRLESTTEGRMVRAVITLEQLEQIIRNMARKHKKKAEPQNK